MGLRFWIIGLLLLLYQPVAAQNLYITGGSILNVEDGEVLPNPGIQIISGKIFKLGELSVFPEYKQLVLEADDYVIPGLIDLHAHYRVVYKQLAHDDTVVMPKLFLANGITATFPAGEVQPKKMLDLRNAINAGERAGPRILSSGPYFGTAAPDWDTEFTVADIYSRVDEWAAAGASGFKAKGITKQHLVALIERAHQHGLTVTAHLNSGHNNSVNPQDAIKMGIDRVEHFLGGKLLADSAHAYVSLSQLDPDDPGLNEIIQLFIEHEVYYDATLATYGAIGLDNSPPFELWTDEQSYLTPFSRNLMKYRVQSEFSKLCAQIYPIKKRIVKRFYDAGGRITVGSDRPLLIDNYLGSGLGGFFIHREMEAMVAAGIPVAEVLKFATIQNAEAMGLADKLGSIKVSKWADLAIIKGSPLENIRNTRNVHTVIMAGKSYKTDQLLRQCVGKLGPVSDSQWFR